MKLYPDAPVFTAFYDSAKMGQDFMGRDIRPSVLQRLPGAKTHYKWFLPALDWAFRRFDLRGYDVVISSASGWAKSVRTGRETAHVCYCHTPIRYIWSDADTYINETGYPAPLKWLFRRLLPGLRRRDLRAARGVDRFVANSSYVGERIKRYYHRDSVVIPPPVDTEHFRPESRKDDYFLVATRLEPYKRVDLAITAARQAEVRLRIMGDGTDRRRLEQLAGGSAEFLGRVSDAARVGLFARARAFLVPQEEDFGITTVEALAAGTPVIAFAVGGSAEILTSETGVLVTEQTPAAFAAAIESFDPAAFTADVLRGRAAEFSETAFASRLEKFIERTDREHRAAR
jgi:glycosyltransferase involved in cell wall biosynthesis